MERWARLNANRTGRLKKGSEQVRTCRLGFCSDSTYPPPLRCEPCLMSLLIGAAAAAAAAAAMFLYMGTLLGCTVKKG